MVVQEPGMGLPSRTDADRQPTEPAGRAAPLTDPEVCPVCHGAKTVNEAPCLHCGGAGKGEVIGEGTIPN